MYYKNKGYKKSRTKAAAVVTLLIIAIVSGSLFYFNNPMNQEYSTSNQSQENTSTRAGTVAVLAQAQRPANTTTGAEATANPTVPTEPQTLTITLPNGWSPLESTAQDVCGQATIRHASVSGTKTLVAYEGTRPDSCNQSILGDTELQARIDRQTGSMTINPTQTAVLCTKEENPACPRGDGKLTVFVTEADRPANAPNQLMFIIEDTTLENDLAVQAVNLAKILETIRIN